MRVVLVQKMKGLSTPFKRIHELFQFNSVRRDRWVSDQALRIPAGSRVLDIGAGAGPYRSLFAHCEYSTHDYAAEPGTIGRYTKLDYTSDIIAISVQDASFDVNLCTEVLEHVSEPILALKEFGRILTGTGKLLVSAPLGSRLHQEPFHFYGGYTPHWYRRFLAEAGFVVESIERNMGFFSYFGEEGLRLSAIIDSRRTTHLGAMNLEGDATSATTSSPPGYDGERNERSFKSDAE